MAASPTQRAERPVIFDDDHTGPIIKDFRYVTSKHNVVVDGHAGEKSITIAVDNTPEVRAMLLRLLVQAETSPDKVLVFSARNAPNAPRRLVLSLAERV